MVIELLREAGEFCSSRTDSNIPKLALAVRNALDAQKKIQVDHHGVKSITVSFLDQWLGPLIVEYGLAKIQATVEFDPPLEPFLAKQMERSLRLRSPAKS